MTKNYFIELAGYNIWANNILHSWLAELTEEQWNQAITSSFGSIGATALHVTGAELIWLERLNGAELAIPLTSTFKGSREELLDLWKKTSKDLKSFVENFEEKDLEKEMFYKRVDGKTYQLPYYQVFAHLFNHSTFHRGQFVILLRQAGFTGVSSTDMSTYFNQQKVQYGNS